MTLSTRTRALAAALAIGTALLSPFVGSAYADVPPPHELGIQCVRYDSNGEPHYYGVGVIVVHFPHGPREQCGPDGNWHVVPFNNTPEGSGPPGSGGVIYVP